jgi:HK97 family phage major capsid protein
MISETERDLLEQLRALEQDAEGREFDEDERGQWNAINERIDEYRVRRERLTELARDPRNTEHGAVHEPTLATTRTEEVAPGHIRALRDRGLRAVDRSALTSQAQDRLDQLIRTNDPGSLGARYLAAVADPDYKTAFVKILQNPASAHLRMTQKEQLAVEEVVLADSMRTMSVGTTTAGGFGIPIEIDPTINLVGSGALCPVRDYATVRTCVSDTLRLVSSDGITAGYTAELTEATDASPTLAQPVVDTAKGQAFVPYSIEVGMDYPDLAGELARLLADARAVVDATMFLTGTGTDQPRGVLTGLTNAAWRVQTTTVAVTALGDIYALKQAIPARFLTNATFAAHPTVWDVVYRFTGGNSAEPLLLPTRDGPVLGIPKFEWSTMSTATTTTASKIMLAGDFKSGFVIADRIGAQLEPIPHVFGATSRYPIGARGLYFWWRTGSTVIASTANAPLRWLEVK